MTTTKPLTGKKNLLLCLDAFGTLFAPSKPIPVAYAQAAARHGINVGDTENPSEVASNFKSAFKKASQENPNYGKAKRMGAKKWWSNVIENTFTPFLNAGQPLPAALTKELLQTYSSKLGYNLYADVHPFLEMVRGRKGAQAPPSAPTIWPWNKTIVGIITNSDDRVPGILDSLGLAVDTRRYRSEDQGKTICKSKRVGHDDIHFTVLSYDVGVEKPDRRIFAAAEEMLGATLHSMGSGTDHPESSFEKLYIGDDLIKDVFGAEDAGWSSVLVERDGIDGHGYGLKVSEEEYGEGEDRRKRTVTKASTLTDLWAWKPVGRA